MKKLVAKFVPWVLTGNRKEGRVETCALEEQLPAQSHYYCWVMCKGLRLRNKATVNERGPCPPSKKISSNQKSRQCFFDWWDCATVFVKKRLMADRGLFLHHDNAPAHTAISVSSFCGKNVMVPLPHAPSHCDFFLFRRMKKHMKGVRFDKIDVVKKKKTKKELWANTEN